MDSTIKHITAEEVWKAASVPVLTNRLRLEYRKGLVGVEVPQRVSILKESPFAAFDTMPAYSKRHKLFVAKIGAVVPQSDPNQPSVHAVVVAFSAETGQLIAILDGDAITQLKCAAVSALVTDLCAPPKAEVLAIIGSGIQAREQIRAVLSVRPITEIRIYSRSQERVRKFICENSYLCPKANFVACESAMSAATGAEIISTATTSTEPVISSEFLEGRPVHINCMGNHTAHSRELPLKILEQALLIVEDRATAVAEAGDVHQKAMTIDQLVTHDAADLQQRQTVFASTGHAFLDLATVAFLIEELCLDKTLKRVD